MSVRILDKHLSVATQGRKVIYFLFNLHYIALVNYHLSLSLSLSLLSAERNFYQRSLELAENDFCDL